MKTLELSAAEQQLSNYDFPALKSQAETAKTNIANATTVDDVKTQICGVWSKVRTYVIWAEAVPVVGKFVTVLADVLDTICPAGN
jgi:hypothetical protein